MFAPSVLDVGDPWKLGYVSAMSLLAFGYWRIVRERWCLAAAIVNAAALAAAEGWWLSGVLLQQLGPEAFAVLLAGGVCFAIAAMISAVKAGIRPRLRRWWLWCYMHLM